MGKAVFQPNVFKMAHKDIRTHCYAITLFINELINEIMNSVNFTTDIENVTKYKTCQELRTLF